MRIILTNDDGIEAPGLMALHEAARALGDPIVVAPRGPLSGCSHRVTTDEPFGVEERAPGWYAVAGTPADCVRIGLYHLAADAAWVFAGINSGGNLGADVYHSGTVAGVREAVLHGLPGVALSQYRRRGLTTDWSRAARWAVSVLAELLEQPCPQGVFWNVNFPHLEPHAPDPPAAACPLDPTPLPLSFHRDNGLWHYNGNYHDRRRQPGSDVDLCFRGHIAVTRLALG